MQFHRFYMILREAEKIETKFKLRSCSKIKTITLCIRESKFQENIYLNPHWNDKGFILFYPLRNLNSGLYIASSLCIALYTPYVCIETRKLVRTGRNFAFTAWSSPPLHLKKKI